MELITGLFGLGLVVLLYINLIPLIIAGFWCWAVSGIAKRNNSPNRTSVEVLLYVGFIATAFVNVLGFVPILVAHVMASRQPQGLHGLSAADLEDLAEARRRRTAQRIRQMQNENRGK